MLNKLIINCSSCIFVYLIGGTFLPPLEITALNSFWVRGVLVPFDSQRYLNMFVQDRISQRYKKLERFHR